MNSNSVYHTIGNTWINFLQILSWYHNFISIWWIYCPELVNITGVWLPFATNNFYCFTLNRRNYLICKWCRLISCPSKCLISFTKIVRQGRCLYIVIESQTCRIVLSLYDSYHSGNWLANPISLLHQNFVFIHLNVVGR